MNDYLFAGVLVLGTIVLLGGGSWVMGVINRKKQPPKP